MINSIEIQNHETHADTIIENLHPGLNIFTGESDEGKSGVIRAITLNAQNRPMGDSYRNDALDPKKDKKKKVRVAIEYKGTGTVARERDGITGGINHYRIDDQKPLKALRTDVPDEVQEVTRMKAVNIQGQHPTEQYFLLADKPGQVAKMFNKVAVLTVMDKALADINAQVRDCNSKINVSKVQMDENKLELEATEWVPKAEKFAKKLKIYGEKFDYAIQTFNTLTSSVSKIQIVEDDLTKFKDITKALSTIKTLHTENEMMSATISKQITLNNLILDINKTDIQLADCLHTDIALKSLKQLEIESMKIHKTAEDCVEIKTYVNEYVSIYDKLNIAEKEYSKALAIYTTTRATEECPTCGRSGK